MVEVIGRHSQPNDYAIRLIYLNWRQQNSQYVRWEPPEIGRGIRRFRPWSNGSVDPLSRGDAELDPAYRLDVEPGPVDSLRVYLTSRDAAGQKYYLESSPVGDGSTHELKMVPAVTNGPPAVRNGENPGHPWPSSFLFLILVQSQPPDDILVEEGTKVGSPYEIPSSPVEIAQSLETGTVYRNPRDTPQYYGPGELSYHKNDSSTSEFHWDVGITVKATTGYKLGPLKGEISVETSTNFGEKSGASREEGRKETFTKPETTVAPFSEQRLRAMTKDERWAQDFDLEFTRVVKHELHANPERIPDEDPGDRRGHADHRDNRRLVSRHAACGSRASRRAGPARPGA